MSEKTLHEVVIPVDPLNVWYHIFDNTEGQTYIAPHWHRGIELSYILQGYVSNFQIGNKSYTSKTGNILVVNSQEIHTIKNQSKKEDLALSVIFPYDMVCSLYPKIDQEIISINDSMSFTELQKQAYAQLQGLLMEFIRLHFSDSSLKYVRMQAIIDQVLVILLSHFMVEKPTCEQIGQRKIYITERLQEITQYVNNNYKNDLSLGVLADECNISKEYLSRFFKREMNLTVDNYINNVRAQHVYKVLLTSKDSLTNIALNNGFSGVRTMNRAFKKLYGITASEYRKNNKN